jgi:hypothetical protein
MYDDLNEPTRLQRTYPADYLNPSPAYAAAREAARSGAADRSEAARKREMEERQAEEVKHVGDALAAGRITLPGHSSISCVSNPGEPVAAVAISVGPLTMKVEEAVRSGLVTHDGFSRRVYEKLVAAMDGKVGGWRRWQHGIGVG